jgi:hypothetical protein
MSPINSQSHCDRRGGKKEKKKKGKKKKKEITYLLFRFFLLFLHESRILIFIKNNMKNTKYILTVRSNSV